MIGLFSVELISWARIPPVGAQDPLVVILKSIGCSVVAQDDPAVVLDPFMVALSALGTPMVALDFSMVALGLSGFPQVGLGFLYGLQVPPRWPWVSVNPSMLALEPSVFCPGGLRGDSVSSYAGPRALYCVLVGS